MPQLRGLREVIGTVGEVVPGECVANALPTDDRFGDLVILRVPAHMGVSVRRCSQ